MSDLPLTKLKPYPKNARTHSRKQIGQVAQSIRTFGFNVPILIDEENTVLAGHARLEAAGATVVRGMDPCTLPRAAKNPVEIEGSRQAHIRDGAALARFLHWVDTTAQAELPDERVVAETLEAATEGARLLNPQYRADPPRIGLDGDAPYEPETVSIGRPPSLLVGDMDAVRARAAHHVDTVIETAAQYHNALEPHAITARWIGDRLEIDTPNQAIGLLKQSFSAYLGLDPAQIVIRWHLDNGLVVIPKSVTPSRITENFDVWDFRLDKDELSEIAKLDQGKRLGPDPDQFGG